MDKLYMEVFNFIFMSMYTGLGLSIMCSYLGFWTGWD
uniref:Uncharacterized protein n=1 Tax=Anguilla anguilla TaxID=7936 RepID=A0A0E9RKS5_ANGAN